MSIFEDKILLISGGIGFFRSAVLKRFLRTDIKVIRIFSRDEKMQDAARQSEETGEIERQLRELLSKELSRENPNRSYYMKQALNYFDHFKDDLFRYRKDGNYPIDNNLAERQVRPFTAMRKGIQHYGSDDGAERAAVYLSVVSTVKLAGVSVWKFLGYFFEDMVTGGSKHRALLKLSAA